MSAHVEAKKQIVEEIKAKIQASKSVVLADYNKLTVLEVTALRNKFKEANCEYKVYKNTLVRKAFNDLGITDFDNDLNGTTATVFCADETSGAAVFARETKANPALVEKVVPKCAYVENKYLDGRPVLNCGENTSGQIDEEVMAILKECYDKAVTLLKENMEVLDKIADYLYQNETITGKEFMNLFNEIKG